MDGCIAVDMGNRVVNPSTSHVTSLAMKYHSALGVRQCARLSVFPFSLLQSSPLCSYYLLTALSQCKIIATERK